MKRFLLFCSGANLDVLRRCPSEENKYVGIGATILLTAALATLSGGYALFSVFGSVPAAAVFGLLWGATIFNLDRVIVSGMRKQRYWGLDLLYAVPRIAVAVLLALVVARPLELRLFADEIRSEWASVQLERRRVNHADAESLTASRMQRLQAEIDGLSREIRAAQAAADAARQAYLDEQDGSAGSGIPGDGSRFREKKAVSEELSRRAADVVELNRSRIDRATRERDRLQDENRQLASETDAVHDAGFGLLARMQMMERLKKREPATRRASLVITLLFLALETAPVLVKLLATLSPYRPYDELLEQHEFEIVETARQDVSVRRQALKHDAQRRIHDSRAWLDVERDMDVRRHEMRRDAELRASEALMSRIAIAQVELGERVVDEWREGELDRIERNPEAYLATMS